MLTYNALSDEMKDRDNVWGMAVADEWMNRCGVEVRVPCTQGVEELGSCNPLCEDAPHNRFLFDFGSEGDSAMGAQVFTR